MSIYEYENIKDKKQMLDKIHAEYKYIQISTLGGFENICLMLSVSLDKKEKWYNGIFLNSRYYQFSIDNYGIVENFNSSYKVKSIRKKKVNTLQEAFDYINIKLQKERRNNHENINIS